MRAHIAIEIPLGFTTQEAAQVIADSLSYSASNRGDADEARACVEMAEQFEMIASEKESALSLSDLLRCVHATLARACDTLRPHGDDSEIGDALDDIAACRDALQLGEFQDGMVPLEAIAKEKI